MQRFVAVRANGEGDDDRYALHPSAVRIATQHAPDQVEKRPSLFGGIRIKEFFSLINRQYESRRRCIVGQPEQPDARCLLDIVQQCSEALGPFLER